MTIAKLKEPWSDRFILGVDPGLSATGVCLWNPIKQILSFETIRTDFHPLWGLHERCVFIANQVNESLGGRKPDVMVIEHMQVYQQRKQKGDPNDLVDLAFLEGVIAQRVRAGACLTPTPRQWKGSIDKKVHHRRLMRELIREPRTSEHSRDAYGLARYGEKTHG